MFRYFRIASFYLLAVGKKKELGESEREINKNA
jgi:hypothetical protein